jgi:hypothetical protein
MGSPPYLAGGPNFICDVYVLAIYQDAFRTKPLNPLAPRPSSLGSTPFNGAIVSAEIDGLAGA